ncbi:hypothetical protein ACFO25_08455 [Paenactinomyces guangxiensis]|uniref:Uncharacterized protein n=1 Tax=Paenactinomyces guangxiensis TaxID=1490290 RepID=A0A7W1WN36_9BACL|nr:hypothetical protein [Paenactinomyces guangxiensis]MBA4492924.1 hypothetical protein [Paenactinomyces guangxiensis]MBH8590227.1 hypothetical protein [Paenactinomyces guangxiensis]
MSPLSVKEISSLLTSRWPSPKIRSSGKENEPPHRNWNSSLRAALVILWGLLVYPQLDPDMRNGKGICSITIDQLVHLFKEYLGDKPECMETLFLLKQHDYIRIQANQRIIPGTCLLAAVDAAKMYRCFRTSVLSRKIAQHYQEKNDK